MIAMRRSDIDDLNDRARTGMAAAGRLRKTSVESGSVR
jgi:hypothetical protein